MKSKKRDEYSCQICHSNGEKLIQIDSIDRLLPFVDFNEVFEAVKNVFNEQDKYIKEFKLECESEVDDNTLLNYNFIETYLHDTDIYINSFNLKDNPFNDKGFEFLTKNKFEGDSLGRNSKWVNMIKFRYHTKNSIEETQSMRIEFFKAGNTDHKLILRHLYDYANLPYRGQGILTQDGFSIVFPLYRLNGTTLNVHHKAYYEDLEPWECPDNELVTLCNHCHMKEHENPIPVKKFAIN